MKKQTTMKAQNQTITVKVNEENPEPLVVTAKAIIEISEAFIKINNSPLKRRAVVLLLQDATKISQRDINLILDVAPKLKDFYVKEVKKS
jgi:hypothetical protein